MSERVSDEPSRLRVDFSRLPAMSALERASWRWWSTAEELAKQLEREQAEADRNWRRTLHLVQ
jgi:hypothetical protein